MTRNDTNLCCRLGEKTKRKKIAKEAESRLVNELRAGKRKTSGDEELIGDKD
jgi:hypothetical protein